MKKLILIFAALVIIAPVAISQDNGEFKSRSQTNKSGSNNKENEESEEKAFGEGTFDVTVGYGFPDMYKSFVKALVKDFQNPNATYTVKGIGPVFLKMEYGLSKLIGLGAVIGYHNISVTETYPYQSYNSATGMYDIYEDVEKLTYTSLSVAARINFHFGTGKRLDPYAGVGAGYSYKTYVFTQTTNNPNGFVNPPDSYNGYFPVYFGISAGLRYYFTPNIGIYGEVGFDKWTVMQGGLAVKF